KHAGGVSGYVAIDNLSVTEGVFVGTADLAVSRVELPLPSCGLGSAEPIGVQVENRGTATITKFKLAYTVNDGTAVEQEFAQPLAPEAKATLVFDTKANFSTKERYTVSVTASVLESDGKEEEKTDNNAASASVAYRAPVVLPFEADFTKNAEEREKMTFAPGTWNYEAPRRGMTTATAAVLQTPCLPFEAEATYRVYLTYRGGTAGAKVKFDLICGLASVPRDEWRLIKHFEINTSGEYQTDVVEIANGPIPGDYAVAIVPQDYAGGLYIQSVKVDRKPAYDIRIMAIRSTIGSQVPVQHAAAPEFEVLVKNFGEKNGDNVKVVITNGETVVGQSTPMNLPVNDSAYCLFTGRLTLSGSGEVALAVEAVLEGTA
ncbi:MAG: hypothetical protein K2O01_02915, partial [Bacteroidales bacterium]|nr:hypothetical protein [Bacteroidales bacterium]